MRFRDGLTQNALLVLLCLSAPKQSIVLWSASLLTLHRANEVSVKQDISNFLRLSLSVETRLGIACYETVGFMCLFII